MSTKASIVDPVDFISGHDHENKKASTTRPIFIGRNNTELWAHAGSNVVFDCLVGRPNLDDHGPVSKNFKPAFHKVCKHAAVDYFDPFLRMEKMLSAFCVMTLTSQS